MEDSGRKPSKQDAVVGQPKQSNKRKSNLEAADGAPSPKRQRTTRGTTSGKTMNYDMKYHPMDDVLRPHQSAIRKAAHGIERRLSNSSSESSNTVDELARTTCTEDSRSPPAASPVPLASTTTVRRRAPQLTGSPSSRRVTRDTNREKPIAYNMKHHPMDDFLRPADAKKRKAKWAADVDNSPLATDARQNNAVDHDGAQEMAQDHQDDEQISPPINPTKTPLNPSPSWTAPLVPSSESYRPPSRELATTDRGPSRDVLPEITPWKLLKNDDRLLYIIQKGTPLTKAMPVAWTDVAKALDARPEAPSSGERVLKTVEALQARYEAIYHNVQEYFGATPDSPTSEKMILRYAEGFDVYDCQAGESYWAYSSSSIVKPTKLSGVAAIARQPSERTRIALHHELAGLHSDSVTILSDTLLKSPPGKPTHHERRNEKQDPLQKEKFLLENDDEEFAQAPLANRRSAMEDIEEGRGLFGSYNDESGYLRQVMGPFEDTQVEESPEDALVASMRNEISADMDELLQMHDLDSELYLASPCNPDNIDHVKERRGDKSKGSGEVVINDSDNTNWETESEDDNVIPPHIAHRLSSVHHTPPHKPITHGHTRYHPEPRTKPKPKTKNNASRNREFSVHEDPPNTTPKIKRQIAKNPRSPGTDVPKENMRERSPSEES
ncbi:MAG: hypothetical protein Q9218_004045 [Villophora microphyllina]